MSEDCQFGQCSSPRSRHGSFAGLKYSAVSKIFIERSLKENSATGDYYIREGHAGDKHEEAHEAASPGDCMYNIVILAAGIGSRLRPLTDTVPKALIRVNKKSILHYQLECLQVLPEGSKVYVATGYLSNLIQQEIDRIDLPFEVVVVENKEYMETNNMYSLLLAMKEIGEDLRTTIVLNGDVVYDKSIIKGLLSDERNDLIAVDVGAYLKESMKVTVKNSQIDHISKAITNSDALGVSIDLYKLSVSSYKNLLSKITDIVDSGKRREWTEVALDLLLKTGDFPAQAFDIKGMPWWEIDNLDDLKVGEIIFNKDADLGDLQSKSLFVFDLDGTLILGEKPTPGAPEFIEFLRKNGKQVAIMTNNSSRGIKETQQVVSDVLGCEFNEDEIFSSTQATLTYLKSEGISTVYPVGTKNFIKDLQSNGFTIDEKNPEAVVVSFDTELTYEKIREATLFLRDKMRYVATHSDLLCPTDRGMIPDAGSILALLKASTNREPDAILGKPSPLFLQYLSKAKGISLEGIAVVGDRLYTDMRMGLESNCTAILVLTGETRISDLGTTPYLPNFVFQSVGELLEYWKLSA